MQRKSYQTQWAAQFFTAAELTRRGYLVSFTLGNAPVVDLLCVSPNGKHFMIDVKGLSSRNFWLVRERESPDDLYFVLVCMPQNEPPEYFVLHGKEMKQRIAELREKTLAANKNWVESGAGINWGMSQQYKNNWEILPQ